MPYLYQQPVDLQDCRFIMELELAARLVLRQGRLEPVARIFVQQKISIYRFIVHDVSN